jgi:hypothetical protein
LCSPLPPQLPFNRSLQHTRIFRLVARPGKLDGAVLADEDGRGEDDGNEERATPKEKPRCFLGKNRKIFFTKTPRTRFIAYEQRLLLSYFFM